MQTPANAELDERTSQAMDSCLGTPVILRQLLQQFTNKDLIQLSLVNKQWSYEARCVLRDRGTLSAGIEQGDSRKDLASFASYLEKMRIVPFSRVRVALFHNMKRICPAASELSYNLVLERLRIKRLSVEFCIDWDRCRNCPEFLLVKRILENYSGVLQVLSFTFGWGQVDMMKYGFANWSFPRLKTLKLEVEKETDADQDFTSFITALASRAPELQEIKMNADISLDENVLPEGSSAVIVPCFSFNPLYERVCDNLLPALRLDTLKICSRHYRDTFNEEIRSRFIPKLLRASVNTLHTVKMDLLLALPLMCYGICLESVTTLQMRLKDHIFENLDPRISTILKRFDFTRIFPKVEKVEIKHELNVFHVDAVDAFLGQGNALLLTESLQDRATNIKQLTLRYFISDSTVLFLAQMFPDVKTISVETYDHIPPTQIPSLWEHFKHLHELKLTSPARPRWIQNLDSVFCGIFPEEVAELREKDDEYLKTVNIVPVMPSITCMKDLRTFTFKYTPEPEYHPGGGIDRLTFWFSKITGFLGFARCPGLAVTFQTPCAEALSHMDPFVTFVSLEY